MFKIIRYKDNQLGILKQILDYAPTHKFVLLLGSECNQSELRVNRNEFSEIDPQDLTKSELVDMIYLYQSTLYEINEMSKPF